MNDLYSALNDLNDANDNLSSALHTNNIIDIHNAGFILFLAELRVLSIVNTLISSSEVAGGIDAVMLDTLQKMKSAHFNLAYNVLKTLVGSCKSLSIFYHGEGV